MRKQIYNLVENGNKAGFIYERIMQILILCSLLPLCFKELNLFLFWVDRITATAFILDYLLRWTTADYKYSSKGKYAFLYYPFTFFALVDLISVLPSFAILNTSFKLLKLFRLSRALKSLKLLRYSKSFAVIVSVIKKEKQPLLAVSALAFGYIILSALIMFQVEPENFDTFFDAFYWAVVTLTTVGYGDVYPLTDIGRVVSMISSFIGIAIVALPTGIITAGYMTEITEQKTTSSQDDK